MKSICTYKLAQHRRLNQPFEFKRFNKITRNIELFIKDNCKGV